MKLIDYLIENQIQFEGTENTLTIGGSLDLEGCTGITALPDNLTIGGWLDLQGTGITALPDNLTIGGWLDLRGTGITALPDNLTIGGELYLEGCTGITALPDNLTIGGGLYLRGTGITALPDNLTIGGSLNLRNTDLSAESTNLKKPVFPLIWNGHILADGILAKIISSKGGNYKVQIVGKKEESYLCVAGEMTAHGKTLKEAKADLIHKIAVEKIQNEPFTLETILTDETYHIITGACNSGIEHWKQTNNISEKEMTVGELLPILERTNAYGLEKIKELLNVSECS